MLLSTLITSINFKWGYTYNKMIYILTSEWTLLLKLNKINCLKCLLLYNVWNQEVKITII